MAASESEAGHGCGGVFAEAGQPGERRAIAGENPRVVPRDPHGRAAEVASPCVIAQTRPGREDTLLAGAGERRKVREPLQEGTVPLPDRRDRRLLEHDLRDPDAIGIGRSPPWKGSLLLARPVQQPLADVFDLHAWRGVFSYQFTGAG